VALQAVWETRGSGSRIAQGMTLNAYYRVLRGKIAEVHFSWDWEETLEAARARLHDGED
jgi:hypothetical protein